MGFDGASTPSAPSPPSTSIPPSLHISCDVQADENVSILVSSEAGSNPARPSQLERSLGCLSGGGAGATGSPAVLRLSRISLGSPGRGSGEVWLCVTRSNYVRGMSQPTSLNESAAPALDCVPPFAAFPVFPVSLFDPFTKSLAVIKICVFW